MEIPGNVFKDISSSVEQFKTNKNYELEIKYDGKISRDAFSNVVAFLRNQGYVEQEAVETLDINITYSGHPYRLSVKGKDHVQEYCVSGKLSQEMVSDIISKRFIDGFKPIVISDYVLKVNMKEETSIKEVKLMEVLSVVDNMQKIFRYKKRYSYVVGPLRYDCTVVKQSVGTTSRHFSQAPETFEVEIEIVQRDVPTDKLVKMLLKSGVQMYAVLNNIKHLITRRECDKVLSEYHALWRNVSASNKQDILTVHEQYRRQYFLGPQAITLELKNVVSDGLAVNTIRDAYTVTEKADGERYLLFVDKEGSAYFINNKMEIKPTKVTGLPPLSLFDGEYITQDAMRRPISVYAIFDLYWFAGKNIMAEPLVDGRLKAAEAFQSKWKAAFDKVGILLYVKTFYHGEDIFQEAQRLYSKVKAGNFLYRVDGLIFTPKNLPVGALYEGGAPDPFSAWNLLYKWKPPEENTIDMQVREVSKGKITMIDGKLHKVFNVYVGYKASKWVAISPRAYLEKQLKQDTQYTIALFNPPDNDDRDLVSFYGEVNADDTVVCANGDVINNNSIVEFSYRSNNILRWVPLRVRKDKFRPNDWGTAMNVWRSISYPVTEDIITGQVKVSRTQVPSEDIYYSRSITRDKFASKNMMNFHSFWVKGHYVFAGLPAIKSLFDIACGKGGDLRKWKDLGIETVYGIDKIRDNIENPNDGVYARMLKRGEYTALNYVFGTFDASQKIVDANVNLLKGDDAYIMKKLLRQRSFDAVSCQMAIHYFFKSEEILDNFLYNVDRFLKPGGYFVGTCLDGDAVKALFRAEGDTTITGKIGNRVLWNITRDYRDDVKVEFGDVIRIYMESIGIEMDEYLVSMNILTQKLKSYHIEFVKTMPFKTIYDEVAAMKDRAGVFEPLSPVEQKYSFLNTVFVFRKSVPNVEPKTARSSNSKSSSVESPQSEPQAAYRIGIALGDGNCFYRALYGAAKHNHLLDTLTQCLFEKPDTDFEDEDKFVKATRELLSKLIRENKDYGFVSGLFNNLKDASTREYKNWTEYMPPYFTRKYSYKKRPKSEKELRDFLAEHVNKNKEWAGQIEADLVSAVFKDCKTIKFTSFNDRIPPTAVFEPNVLYLFNRGDSHYDYLIFNTGPKLVLKKRQEELPKKIKLTLKKAV